MESTKATTTKNLGELLSMPMTPEELVRCSHLEQLAMKSFKEQQDRKAKRNYTSLEEKDWSISFETLPIHTQNRVQIERLQKWHPGLKQGIMLHGSVGTGKSTACKAIINRFASKTYRCFFINTADVMQKLKDSIDTKGSSVGEVTERFILPNLLVLDDLGTEKSSEWAIEKLFLIFEKRVALSKHTLFTTNLSTEEINRVYGTRIHDRLLEFCSWVHFRGDSFRKKMFVNEI